MIKTVGLLTRKTGWTHEQFMKHWVGTHAPLAHKVPGLRRYVQNHIHGERTQGDESSTLILKMDGGATAIAEESWANPGGMDDRAEVYGSEGVAYADLLRGNAIHT